MNMKRTAHAVLFVCLMASCAPFGSAIIDYVDFVRWDGIEYLTRVPAVGRELTEADLGPLVFQVKQTLAQTRQHDPTYEPGDGDAAFVAVGEPVYAVRGYATWFRVAAHHSGRLVLYEANHNASAKLGRDMFDIEGKVAALAIIDETDGKSVVARIVEPRRVETLVRLVLDGTVGGVVPPSPLISGGRRPPPDFVLIAFELKDGTASVHSFDLVSSFFPPNILIGGTFRDTIAALRATVPTPTPR
jgi:hypothetical protein